MSLFGVVLHSANRVTIAGQFDDHKKKSSMCTLDLPIKIITYINEIFQLTALDLIRNKNVTV